MNFLTDKALKIVILSLLLIVGFMGIKIYFYKNEIKHLNTESNLKIEKYKTMYKNTLQSFKDCEVELESLKNYNLTAQKEVKRYQVERRKYEKVKLNSLNDYIDFAKRLQ